MVSIYLRPPGIEDRLMPGHWLGDLITCSRVSGKRVGSRCSVGAWLECCDRLLLLAKVADATAASSCKACAE